MTHPNTIDVHKLAIADLFYTPRLYVVVLSIVLYSH